MDELLFEVTEPSGKVYRAFTDGRIEGFAEGARLSNRYPALLAVNVVAERASNTTPALSAG